MKFHLRILYGADDRFQITRQTLDVCSPYFSTMRVVNSGPPELATQFINLPKNAIIENLNFFFGDLESARNALLYDIDIGDWVVWLDADERPTQLMLDGLEEIVAYSDKCGIVGVRSPACNHLWRDGKRYGRWDFNYRYDFPFDAEDYAQKMSDFHEKRHPNGPIGTIGRMMKKTSPYFSANTNFGGHGMIINHKNNFDMFATRFPIVHLKHQVMEYQSFCTCTYVNPCLNAPVKNGYKPYANSVEFKKLREFQNRTGVKTQNDLCRKLHWNLDLQFKAELKELFMCDEFKNSQLFDNFFKHYHTWAEKFDCSWATPAIYCGESCCRYNNIQL